MWILLPASILQTQTDSLNHDSRMGFVLRPLLNCVLSLSCRCRVAENVSRAREHWEMGRRHGLMQVLNSDPSLKHVAYDVIATT